MDQSEILAAIDAEIKKLRRVRELLQGGEGAQSPVKQKSAPSAKVFKAKRKMSAEGRRRIAEAMKRRWASARKSKAKGGGTGDGGYGFTGE